MRLGTLLPWTRRWDAPILAGVALLLRLAVVAFSWDRVPPTADGKFYHIVAQRIAHGEGYTWLWPDGAVTYAAHYPVGYPALMSVPYALFGAVPGAVMVINAILGALVVWLSHELCLDALKVPQLSSFAREGAGLVGVGLAVSPTLVGYTPALMTEGAVAAFLVLAAWFAVRARSSVGASKAAALWRTAVALALGAAVLLRPQSILFAPVLGFLSVEGTMRRRMSAALLTTTGCLAVTVPWTLRNCDRMERCVFVSANGGWNLLIGTFPEGRGAWVALEGERVPIKCRDVFQEAAKDKCFGREGMARIRKNPVSWLSLVPAKLRATLDHTAAAAEHLVESGALPRERKRWLSYPEFGVQRAQFLLALVGAFAWHRRDRKSSRRWDGRLLLALGVAGFVGLGAALGWLACVLFFVGAPRRLDVVGIGTGIFSVVVTMVVHGAFFGAGRYALPLIPLVAPLAAIGVAEALRMLGYASRSGACAVKFDTRSRPER